MEGREDHRDETERPETREDVLQRLRERFSGVKVDLSEELAADREREAERDD